MWMHWANPVGRISFVTRAVSHSSIQSLFFAWYKLLVNSNMTAFHIALLNSKIERVSSGDLKIWDPNKVCKWTDHPFEMDVQWTRPCNKATACFKTTVTCQALSRRSNSWMHPNWLALVFVSFSVLLFYCHLCGHGLLGVQARGTRLPVLRPGIAAGTLGRAPFVYHRGFWF